MLQKCTTTNDACKIKWEKELNKEIHDTIWNGLYKQLYILTASTKLRYFQIRLINRTLITNIQLYKWNLRTDEMCTFCKKESETYVHMFINCKIIKRLWSALQKWLDYYCFIKLERVSYDLILNRYRDSFAPMVNTIILITKQYIYRCKCQETDPRFPELISGISWYKSIEKMAALKHNKLKQHNDKWSMYDKV